MANTFAITLKAQNSHAASSVIAAVTQQIPDFYERANGLQSAVFEVTGTSGSNSIAIGSGGIVTTNLAGAGAVTQKDPVTGSNLAFTDFRGLFLVCDRADAATAPGVLANTDVKTSTTSLAIGTGTKTFTVATSLGYVSGQRVRAVSAANTANYMEGIVSSYNSGTGALTTTIDAIGGSGTLADWTVYALPVAQVYSTGFMITTAASAATPINMYEGSCMAFFDGTGTAISSVERFKHAATNNQSMTISLIGTTGLKVSVLVIGS